MNLDNLHKVMKGDMTIDQACEGMTDDYEIGHVSHRKDGDYKKVAQGKWVPVKAGGQKPMGAKKEDGAGKPQTGQATQEEIDTYKEIVRQFAKNKNPMTEKIMDMAKEHLMKSRGVSAEQIAKIGSDVFWENDKAGQKGGDKESGNAQFKMGDKVRVKKEWLNPGESQMTYVIANEPDSSAAIISPEKWDKPLRPKETVRWDMLERVPENEPAPAEKPAPAEPKAEGGKRQLKRRADGTIIYETPEDVIYDMVENYNELDRGDLQGVIEAAAMSHGWDENEILEEVDRQAAEKYDLGINEDDLEEASNELKERREQMYNNERYGVNQLEDAAAPARLTRDTKIRLSQIKQEQTQDKTYNVGETSQRKDGLYKKVAPGKWEPVKGGGSAGAPAGGKMSKEDLTKRVGEMLKTDPTMRKMVGAGPAPKADPAKMSKEELTKRVGELMKTDKNLQKVVKAAGGTIPGGKSEAPEPIALNEREQGEANRVMENLKNFDEKYTDRTKVRMKPGKNDHWDVFYGGKKIATMIGSVMQRDTAKKMGWFGEKG